MMKNENILTKVHCQKDFCEKCALENNENIILNSIRVYKMSNGTIEEEIDFEIYKSENENVFIVCPKIIINNGVLFYEKIINTTVMEIGANEYLSVHENNGNFTFVMENENNG